MRIGSVSNTSFQGLWNSKTQRYRGIDRYYPHTIIRAEIATYRPFKDEEVTQETKEKCEQVKSYFCKFFSRCGDYTSTDKNICLHKTVIGEPLAFTEQEYKNLSTTLKNANKKWQTLRDTVPNLEDLVKYTTDKKTKNIYSTALKTAKEDLENIPKKIDEMEETTNRYFEESPFSEMRSEKTWKHEFVELSKSRTNEVIEDIKWEEVYPYW